MRIYFVGIDGEQAIDSETTRKQIEEVKKLECALELDGRKLDWQTFDNPGEPRSLFQAILRDRKKRIDQGILMAHRPPFAIVTANGRRAVRLEFYEGHNNLKCSYDLRAPELQDKELPLWMPDESL